MNRIFLTIFFAVLLVKEGTAHSAQSTPSTVLVVLGHPDDELFMAPALAALARRGAQVDLVYATRGDEGPGVSGLPPGDALGEVRLAESICAKEALGARSVTNFNLGDSTLGVSVHRPGSSARRLTNHLEQLIPQADLILTWGPDGGYGHGDHRMVSAITTQLVQTMPLNKRPKLLYVGIPAGRRPNIPTMVDWAETEPKLLTEPIAYLPGDLAAASKAAQCHATQFDEKTRQSMMQVFHATIGRGMVHFRPAL
jgi:LmbE family N-acetylglucosaminyl deacetylase